MSLKAWLEIWQRINHLLLHGRRLGSWWRIWQIWKHNSLSWKEAARTQRRRTKWWVCLIIVRLQKRRSSKGVKMLTVHWILQRLQVSIHSWFSSRNLINISLKQWKQKTLLSMNKNKLLVDFKRNYQISLRSSRNCWKNSNTSSKNSREKLLLFRLRNKNKKKNL